ncbi:MAG: penicillin acylase family protein, partial [Acidobacteria bacterium]|nr:penicillin acylase family protein [Acidobacteriota bacterium]
MFRTIVRGIGILLLVALVVVAGAYFWLRAGGRPQRDGDAVLAGLGSAVTVRFDARGVPDVEADSEADAWRAVGWLHANDRLFQMEMSRRAASGRLSELFGARAVRFDQRMRRLRFRRLAEAAVASARPETRAALEAYAEGVNAWLAARGGDLPPELRLLRVRPEPWTSADTISLTVMMARNLSPIEAPPELERFELLRAFGPERARELDGAPDADLFPEIEELARTLAAQPDDVGARAESSGLGSNNWTVAPSRARDGDALVANDPHLGLGLPNVWYQISIRTPTYRAAGMTLPGSPPVILGRGPSVAWAMTNLYVDDVDVFFERPDAEGKRVARGDGWAPIESARETILVDDGESVEVEVKWTDRGTYLDADVESGLPARSLAWGALEPGDQFAAIVALAQASSVADVRAAIEPWVFPPQNLLVADRRGEILWTPIGRAPDRFGWDGRFPAPGWSPEVGWRGLLPAAANPELLDPEEGVIATANSFLPVPVPEWFGEDFDTSFRMDRIRESLAARDDWDVESFSTLQGDIVSEWARFLVARIGDGYEGDAARAATALAGWDGAMALSGPSALFALFERALQRATFEDEAEAAGIGRFGTRWRLLRL